MPDPGPLAPARFPDLPPVAGARVGAVACGVRYEGRTDLCLIAFESTAAVAGVLTRSQTAAAPVEWCRARLPGGRARAVLINSGNANAFTGQHGRDAVAHIAAKTAEILGCNREEVFVASTGVIGEPLPDDRIAEALAGLYASRSPTGWQDGAAAIMTTGKPLVYPELLDAWRLLQEIGTVCGRVRGRA